MARLTTTDLHQLKSTQCPNSDFVNLFCEKLARLIKVLEKSTKKEGLVEF
jgi:hypothetical protein